MNSITGKVEKIMRMGTPISYLSFRPEYVDKSITIIINGIRYSINDTALHFEYIKNKLENIEVGDMVKLSYRRWGISEIINIKLIKEGNKMDKIYKVTGKVEKIKFDKIAMSGYIYIIINGVIYKCSDIDKNYKEIKEKVKDIKVNDEVYLSYESNVLFSNNNLYITNIKLITKGETEIFPIEQVLDNPNELLQWTSADLDELSNTDIKNLIITETATISILRPYLYKLNKYDITEILIKHNLLINEFIHKIKEGK